jgi:hypothetical protein
VVQGECGCDDGADATYLNATDTAGEGHVCRSGGVVLGTCRVVLVLYIGGVIEVYSAGIRILCSFGSC